ncbi:uncharacterized protein BX663DRAFT_556162 [Cokeromyces recurvatus]|uniref:uncharacterized protein n=1 Tax=Cokeromyces recurvatus TaxID=90255 RepID=UPI00221EAA7A|nr:uncharacterized protein BX663DRAFT_556162 [Cokeromyces recurvatus]KAI7898088.1 hypothetical protein BX663DRAFT_556162 [Cokeromyces recurvatus]
MSKVIAKDFFIIDTATGYLRQRTDLEARYPTLLCKFRVAVGSNLIQLGSNLSHYLHTTAPTATPPLQDDGLWPILETQMSVFIRFFDSPKNLGLWIRNTLFEPQAITEFSPTKWDIFWYIPLPPAAHIVWFRTIHKKIPTKRLLHYLVPDTHPSSACIHCHHPEDILKHFIYEYQFSSVTVSSFHFGLWGIQTNKISYSLFGISVVRDRLCSTWIMKSSLGIGFR